jgi:hypothetical protein
LGAGGGASRRPPGVWLKGRTGTRGSAP